MSDYCEGGIKHFRHHLPMQMRFNDIDLLGHLNNSVYFTFMDLAKVRYFQAALGELFRYDETGLVIVNVNCDFCKQTLFDDVIEVETAITAFGDKSLTIEQRVFSPTDNTVRCRCRTIMAAFDPKTMTSVHVPDQWRKAVEEYENAS